MDNTMANEFMNIPNDDSQNYPSVDYKLWLKLNDPTNQNVIKVPKVGKVTSLKILS